MPVDKGTRRRRAKLRNEEGAHAAGAPSGATVAAGAAAATALASPALPAAGPAEPAPTPRAAGALQQLGRTPEQSAPPAPAPGAIFRSERLCIDPVHVYSVTTIDGSALEVEGWTLLSAGFKFEDEILHSSGSTDLQVKAEEEEDDEGQTLQPHIAPSSEAPACSKDASASGPGDPPQQHLQLPPHSPTQQQALSVETLSVEAAEATAVEEPVVGEGWRVDATLGPEKDESESDSTQAVSIHDGKALVDRGAGGAKQKRNRRKQKKPKAVGGDRGVSSFSFVDWAAISLEAEGPQVMFFSLYDGDLALFNPYMAPRSPSSRRASRLRPPPRLAGRWAPARAP
ncbi:unnamed protein product [Prorocentrum cordatum]|uniref:Uncharacterized protein n=1 Tax=Prorocentrum cordatum TaxID=2364126 RepID=A0ABN9Q3U7_9DINO|nr:unnamed protein product [Polarella glacialis]